MQTPTLKTPVTRCISLGLFSQAMLAKFPGNPVLVGLSATMGAATTALAVAQAEYAQSVLALIPLRVAVKFADHVADKVVRDVERAAVSADGAKGGRLAGAAFPHGVTPIVRPVGQTQCDEMRALEGRLKALEADWPGAAAERAKIEAERIVYEDTLKARKAGMASSADKRAQRDAVREDYLDVYAATAARVKEQFPRQRAQQDLFFEKIAEAPVADDAEDDDADPTTPPA